jgi:hypothetical protein
MILSENRSPPRIKLWQAFSGSCFRFIAGKAHRQDHKDRRMTRPDWTAGIFARAFPRALMTET